ncbi:MAG: hypothetical protein A2W71_00710 [Candidatus Nealsonbacteria bacterium RIFCSPLOWO2_02_39_8]|uniref:Uncharacterized protein n=1 Tax=Candidatus Nealsonbacteria bacterium RIFCSPLOWO2_02_39_8 TaxID=1801674 RepID=A0A1G2EJR1_9BACT|nr:MAG: hypothetical protein US88_C0011G0011 [Parcubacteria group bacterium GW2011_GWA2_38_27]OGZ21060.1 MAG: hypothetical protein A2W55_01550 [Candidatus Nealsonbacteria bacterium RIFCSPHIGHO2_02_38_10]OGZ26019.1 MAG: hypothetical protein A2W71_00710 [Candidatus Nealsonbacteria bacterium RIFCSPLOWO2_02_39_8]
MKKILILFVAVLGAGLFFAGVVFAVDVLPDGAIQEMIVNDGGVDENGVPITEFIFDFPEGDSATNDGIVQEQAASGGAVLGSEVTAGASADANLTGTDNDVPENLDKSVNFFRIENLWWILLLAIIISLFLFWLFWREKKKKEKERQQGIK